MSQIACGDNSFSDGDTANELPPTGNDETVKDGSVDHGMGEGQSGTDMTLITESLELSQEIMNWAERSTAMPTDLSTDDLIKYR